MTRKHGVPFRQPTRGQPKEICKRGSARKASCSQKTYEKSLCLLTALGSSRSSALAIVPYSFRWTRKCPTIRLRILLRLSSRGLAGSPFANEANLLLEQQVTAVLRDGGALPSLAVRARIGRLPGRGSSAQFPEPARSRMATGRRKKSKGRIGAHRKRGKPRPPSL